MPTNPVLVYEKENGTPTYMHSVDAREAVQLGDYTYSGPPEKDVPPEERAAARAKFQSGLAVIHPEMQTEEERQRHRDEANEKAELTAMIPEGAQVVVMAPSASERSQRQSSARASSTPPATPAPAPATTTPPASETGRRARE